MPGDRVKCCTADRRLLVNGRTITEPYVYPATAGDLAFDITVPADRSGSLGITARTQGLPLQRRADQRRRTARCRSPAASSGAVVVWPLSKLRWLSTRATLSLACPLPGRPRHPGGDGGSMTKQPTAARSPGSGDRATPAATPTPWGWRDPAPGAALQASRRCRVRARPPARGFRLVAGMDGSAAGPWR